MPAAALATLPAPPIAVEKSRLAAELIRGLDSQALHWLSGYMAGAAARASEPAGPVAALAAPQARIRPTVLYGSQTGNAKRVAEGLAAELAAAGLEPVLVRADAYATHRLKDERLLYLVISTHSGSEDQAEPPDDSRGFCEFLLGRRAPKLPELAFAVLALGDSSYPDFCGIGRELDARLEELGARRLFARGEADVDIDSVAKPWLGQALAIARKEAGSEPAPPASAVVTPLHPARSTWSRERPFAAEVLLNQPIVAADSGKRVHHLELSLAGSGIRYQPGDALGIWPVQSEALVEAVLATLGLDGTTPVTWQEETLPLAQWLRHRRELTVLTRPFVAAHAARSGHAALEALLQPENREALAKLLSRTQLLDFLRRYPAGWNAGALVGALRPLAPRSYSIASSQRQVDEEVHLTVALLEYESDGEVRQGVASRHLCGLVEGASVPVFPEPNERFRLPADPARDLLMIGPGTGVAPFRAFLQERAATEATGRNWLFFGNPHRRTDFLYQLEWQQAKKDGLLTRLDVAFSRDQAEKVYVQHRLREHGREVWDWLEGGAQLYVCGDAERMAPDVHAALADIAVEHGGKSPEAAAEWLSGLLAAGRYARDVY